MSAARSASARSSSRSLIRISSASRSATRTTQLRRGWKASATTAVASSEGQNPLVPLAGILFAPRPPPLQQIRGGGGRALVRARRRDLTRPRARPGAPS